MSKLRERKRVRRPMVTAARWAGLCVRYGVHRMMPGLAGALAVSVGVGAVAGHFLPGLGIWIGLVVAGGFALWFGTELNAGPPRQEQD